MTTLIMTTLILMASLGCIIGISLAIASKIFYVYVDPLVEAVDDALPGANCGGCGYAGCGANAEAIVAGKSPPDSCVAGGEYLAETIAGLLGLSVEAKEPDIAEPGCTYNLEKADRKFVYAGITDCRAAALLDGGMKVCQVGCLGLGTCVAACPFNALKMGDNGLPVVDREKCTGCGTCERVCPKHIIKLSSVTRRILKEYTVDDCTTPCQRACPAGINISEYIRQITLGDYGRALAVIKERLPFPTVIGRICPRFCEFECRRNLVDEPVAINGLKRFVADYEKEHGRTLPFMAPGTERKVAVVGGGVEGLSAAYFCARLGHSPVVLEASDKLGGLLRKAIARERLPLDSLDYDLAALPEMGVTVTTGKAAGRDFTIDALLAENYETVFLASGGWDSRLAAQEELVSTPSPIPGAFLLIDLLTHPENITCGTEVVLYANELPPELATKAVEACRQAGAGNITLLVREKQDPPDIPGITVIAPAALKRLEGTGPAITGAAYTDLNTGQEHLLAAETIIFAAGRFPELIFARPPAESTEEGQQPEEETVPPGTPVDWQAVPPLKNPLLTTQPGLFAAGEPLSDIDAAVKAMAAGRRGAAAMHMIMYGDPLSLPDNVITCNSVIQTVESLEGVSKIPRQIMPHNDRQAVAEGAELEAGFSEQTARNEADRCLQCGIICYERR